MESYVTLTNKNQQQQQQNEAELYEQDSLAAYVFVRFNNFYFTSHSIE